MSLYWIAVENLKLAIAARPRGNDWLDGDMRSLRAAGIDALVSALTLPEAEELGLKDEEDCCRRCGIEFLSFPIEDRAVPGTANAFDTFLRDLSAHLGKGKRVAIHCRAGIGRSAIIAACVLTRNGLSAEAAFSAIEKARGVPVPDTPEQRRWVEEHFEKQKTEPR